MRRSGAFIDDSAGEKVTGKKRARTTNDDDDDGLLCLDEAMSQLDDLDTNDDNPVERLGNPPPAKRSSGRGQERKVSRSVDSSSMDRLPGESLEEMSQRHGREFLERCNASNEGCFGTFHPYILPVNADEVYRKKKLASFGITITLPVKVAAQFKDANLYGNAEVMKAFEHVKEIFQVGPIEGRSLSDSKKQLKCFLKKVDCNAMYRRDPMRGAHELDCVERTEMFASMEVQPGAQSRLHVQGHLNVYYYYDQHFIHIDPHEIERVFEKMGYEWARVHVEYKKTEVFDSIEYTMIPPGKKTRDYWEKKTNWKDAAAVKSSKGGFSKTCYLGDD